MGKKKTKTPDKLLFLILEKYIFQRLHSHYGENFKPNNSHALNAFQNYAFTGMLSVTGLPDWRAAVSVWYWLCCNLIRIMDCAEHLQSIFNRKMI